MTCEVFVLKGLVSALTCVFHAAWNKQVTLTDQKGDLAVALFFYWRIAILPMIYFVGAARGCNLAKILVDFWPLIQCLFIIFKFSLRFLKIVALGNHLLMPRQNALSCPIDRSLVRES